jgi:hypothetical protein
MKIKDAEEFMELEEGYDKKELDKAFRRLSLK